MNAQSCSFPNQFCPLDCESLLKKFATATAGILYIYDIDRNCNLYVNQDIGVFLGYQPGEIDSLSSGLINQLLHPEDLARIPEHLQNCRQLQDGASIGFEYRARKATGEWQWIYTQKTVFTRDESGVPQQLLGTTTDIMSHKLVEAELEQRVSQRTADLIELNHELLGETLQHQKTKEQLHTVLDAVPGMISWLDDDLHYLGVNQQIADRCQLNPEDFIGRQLGFLNPKGDKFTEFARNFFQGSKNSARQEVDREQFTFLTIAQKYNRGKAAVFIQIDITDRKAIEAQLERANDQLANANTELAYATEQKDQMLLNMSNLYAELARATRLKDEFLANMSHELRTPLNAILGMSEGLLDRLCGEITDRQRKAILAIEQSGKHLLELINDILDLAKIESGKLDLKLANVPIRQLFDNSLCLIKQLALQKNILLTQEVHSSLESVYVDERRIRQALINLLSNAVKFTPESGQVSLKAQPSSDGSSIQLMVLDTGIGIALTDQAQLFDPFIQIDSRLNRQYSGTGLGLALVKRIAQLHQGAVRIESAVGRGSTFIISLPLEGFELRSQFAKNPQEVMIHPLGQLSSQPPTQMLVPAFLPHYDDGYDVPCAPKGRRILLADDNHMNILLFSEYLEDAGYDVMLAKNGQEAIDMTLQEKPDLLIMDIQMPKVDGLTAIRQLRQNQTLAQLPIIALTALAMPGDREKCLNAGASEYITKPVSLKNLTRSICQLLGTSDE